MARRTAAGRARTHPRFGIVGKTTAVAYKEDDRFPDEEHPDVWERVIKPCSRPVPEPALSGMPQRDSEQLRAA